MKNRLWLVFLMIGVLILVSGCSPRIIEEPPTESAPPVIEDLNGVTPVAVESEWVITAVSDPWPPFIDPNSPTQGLTMEIVRAAFRKEGYEVDLEIVPWARAEEEVKTGVKDILTNVWYTDSRSEYLLFGEQYAVNELTFIKRKGDPFEFEDMKSLKGKIIGVIQDYNYGDAFVQSQEFTHVPVAHMIQNIKSLIAGRIDLTLEDKIVVTTLINREDPELMHEIEFTEKPLGSSILHVAAGIANPRAPKIIDAYNRGLAAIKADGTYDQILENYGLKD